MLIKAASERSQDIETLQALLATPGITASTRALIDKEIRNIRTGAKGEAEAAYEIEFHHKASRNWAVIHDLRIEHQGRVAQIDHLLINRWLEIWVCESKHFSEGVAINEQGEFTGFVAGRPYGVPSPLEQNRKHVAVLQAVLGSSIVQLPTRLGLTLKPAIQSVILVSKGARISRPKTKLDGIDRVIKSDQLRDLIERRIVEESAASSLLSMGRFISAETLEDLAKQIAGLHRPITFDWAGKFGLKGQGAAQVPVAQPPVTEVIQRPAERLPTPDADLKPASQEPQPIVDDDLHQGRLSTSKLAAKLGIKGNSVMLERLMSAGYLAQQGDQHVLTDRAIAAGAVRVEKSRFGPYFLWPESLSL
ncbi:MAG: NERD domain-containing protein [Burkholderiaceae bacterium]|nr:NERD domain-containing protein [Burkholderiaceae bacterium]